MKFPGSLRVVSKAKTPEQQRRVASLIPVARKLLGVLLNRNRHNVISPLVHNWVSQVGDRISVIAIRPNQFTAIISPVGVPLLAEGETPEIEYVGFSFWPYQSEDYPKAIVHRKYVDGSPSGPWKVLLRDWENGTTSDNRASLPLNGYINNERVLDGIKYPNTRHVWKYKDTGLYIYRILGGGFFSDAYEHLYVTDKKYPVDLSDLTEVYTLHYPYPYESDYVSKVKGAIVISEDGSKFARGWQKEGFVEEDFVWVTQEFTITGDSIDNLAVSLVETETPSYRKRTNTFTSETNVGWDSPLYTGEFPVATEVSQFNVYGLYSASSGVGYTGYYTYADGLVAFDSEKAEVASTFSEDQKWSNTYHTTKDIEGYFGNVTVSSPFVFEMVYRSRCSKWVPAFQSNFVGAFLPRPCDEFYTEAEAADLLADNGGHSPSGAGANLVLNHSSLHYSYDIDRYGNYEIRYDYNGEEIIGVYYKGNVLQNLTVSHSGYISETRNVTDKVSIRITSVDEDGTLHGTKTFSVNDVISTTYDVKSHLSVGGLELISSTGISSTTTNAVATGEFGVTTPEWNRSVERSYEGDVATRERKVVNYDSGYILYVDTFNEEESYSGISTGSDSIEDLGGYSGFRLWGEGWPLYTPTLQYIYDELEESLDFNWEDDAVKDTPTISYTVKSITDVGLNFNGNTTTLTSSDNSYPNTIITTLPSRPMNHVNDLTFTNPGDTTEVSTKSQMLHVDNTYMSVNLKGDCFVSLASRAFIESNKDVAVIYGSDGKIEDVKDAYNEKVISTNLDGFIPVTETSDDVTNPNLRNCGVIKVEL